MEKDQGSPLPLKPFTNIALAFSGGGFRAASYSLGTLSYLHNLQIDSISLSERIGFISSSSGGTITAIAYSSQRHNITPFPTFFNELLNNLAGESILEEVLATLTNDKSWNQPGSDKSRNLINSFAKVYDKVLFKGETMATYFDRKLSRGLEVCFNTTEFYRGLSFRFQTEGSEDKRQLIGNNYLWFDNNHFETFKKIKLADILAASSCFPMGFEPILYPQDFTYTDSIDKTLSSKQLRSAMHYENYKEEILSLNNASFPSFAFMDGGITDNQGLSSLMLADKKRRHRVKPTPFDLIIVTDVASYFMDSYESPEFNQKKGWRDNTLGYYEVIPEDFLRIIFSLQSAALSIMLVFGVAACLFPELWIRIPATIIAASALTIFMLIIFARTSKIGKKVILELQTFDIKSFLFANFKLERYLSGTLISKLTSYVKLTKLGVFEQMIKARIISVMLMVTDVNLKQVRRLIYEKFYNDPCWDDRRVPNFIYELSTYNQATRNKRFKNKGRLKWAATDADKQLLLADLNKLHPIAEEARVTGTTLWFDAKQTKNETLKKIVATGQFTTCANLLEYVISLERKNVQFDTAYEKELKTIRAILEADFIRFKTEPFFLYDRLINNTPKL
jgi:predicted acylesterase/phospholipase RssA